MPSTQSEMLTFFPVPSKTSSAVSYEASSFRTLLFALFLSTGQSWMRGESADINGRCRGVRKEEALSSHQDYSFNTYLLEYRHITTQKGTASAEAGTPTKSVQGSTVYLLETVPQLRGA